MVLLRPGPFTPLSMIFVVLSYGMRRNYFFGDSKGVRSSKEKGYEFLSRGPGGGTRTTPFGILILSYPPQRSQNFHVATEDSMTKWIHEIPCTTFCWRRSCSYQVRLTASEASPSLFDKKRLVLASEESFTSVIKVLSRIFWYFFN